MTAPLAPLVPRGAVLGDEVYARLGEAILDGRLAPGDRLRDQELAEWLGVSRTPVREALQRLERVGLVEVSPNRYTRVSLPNQKTEVDTFELVAYNMGVAVHMAATRCSDEVLAQTLGRLDAVIDASRVDDPARLAVESHQFFREVTRASGNIALIQFIREYEIAIRRNLAGWQPFIACPVSRTAAYERFRDAFAARDGARAEDVLREIHGFA
ncbi:GntR family transcriptional regulator [Microbacterium yannicii]|jgi:DNA-binding GntR family transcriptional regulator|uniref:GntR family transcriptional regulator n=1 Tax=Microbacterium yannicii TaxID=671622 RepID=UPI0002FBB170|nr:GntR family transcriptional regulator [Microbacterium yannicii]